MAVTLGGPPCGDGGLARGRRSWRFFTSGQGRITASSRPDASSESVPLFLHLPKTGGTTLEIFIYCQFEDQELTDGWIGDGLYFYRGALLVSENTLAGFRKRPAVAPLEEARAALNRPDVALIMGHFNYGLHQYVNRATSYITVMRDPVERVLSLYYHVHNYPDYDAFHKWVTSRNVTLEEFVFQLALREVDNDQVRRISRLEPNFGQCSPEMVGLAKENLERDFAAVGTTERFDETLIVMCKTLGWTPNFYVPKQVNSARPRADDLPVATIDAIRELNRFDVELYDYVSAQLDAKVREAGPGFQEQLAWLRTENAAMNAG